MWPLNHTVMGFEALKDKVVRCRDKNKTFPFLEKETENFPPSKKPREYWSGDGGNKLKIQD
jgi:hypothetical protein